tara:strand:- start:278 stop:484 length:207 start_codon:yes stop_codon:yes gene_type:complete
MDYLDDLSFQKDLIKARRKRSPVIKQVFLTEKEQQVEIENYLGSTVTDKDFYDLYGQSEDKCFTLASL